MRKFFIRVSLLENRSAHKIGLLAFAFSIKWLHVSGDTTEVDKCAQYWSSNPEVTETFEHIQITTLSTESNPARLENTIIRTFHLRGKNLVFFILKTYFERTLWTFPSSPLMWLSLLPMKIYYSKPNLKTSLPEQKEIKTFMQKVVLVKLLPLTGVMMKCDWVRFVAFIATLSLIFKIFRLTINKQGDHYDQKYLLTEYLIFV